MGLIDIDLYERKGRTIKAQFNGICALDPEHDIVKGKPIAKVRLRDNTLVTVGWGCSACIRDMPRGK